jgi:hypothetical protein
VFSVHHIQAAFRAHHDIGISPRGGAIAGKKKAPGKILDFTESLDLQIFFREEKNSQIPVFIIHAEQPPSVRYRT